MAELTRNERPRHRFISMTFFDMDVREFNQEYGENKGALIVCLRKKVTFAVYAEIDNLNWIAPMEDNLVSQVVRFKSQQITWYIWLRFAPPKFLPICKNFRYTKNII
jgi:hypothetical protein